MKSLRTILFIAVVLAGVSVSHAATRVTAFLWVTNYAVHSNSLTFNSSDIRYASTNITNSATQWAVTNTSAWTATNLLTHLANNAPLGLPAYSVIKSFTNADVLEITAPISSNLTVVPTGSGGSNWAWVRYETGSFNLFTNFIAPRSAITNTTAQSNLVSALVDWMNQPPRSEERVGTAAPIFANYADTTSTETISNKTLVFVILDGTGQLRNAGLSNVLGTNSTFWASFLRNSELSNVVAQAFKAINPTVMGSLNFSNASYANAWQFQEIAPEHFGFYNEDSLNYFLQVSNAAGAFTIQIGANPSTDRTTNNGVFYSTSMTTPLFNAIVGAISNLVATNGFVGSLTSTNVGLTNGTVVAVELQRIKMYGHQTNFGALLHRSALNTSIVGGPNVLNRGTNHFIVISSADTLITIDAISSAFGDGDWVWAINQTPTNINLKHESNATGAPDADRLGTASSSTVTVPPGGAFFAAWNSTHGRWRVLYPDPLVGLQPASTILSNITTTPMPGSAMLSNAVASGFITNASHGAIANLASTNTLTTAGTFYRWTNSVGVRTNGFATSNGTNLVNQVAGVFDLSFAVTGTSSTTLDGGVGAYVFTNGVIVTNLGARSVFFTGGTVDSTVAASGLVYLPAFTVIDLRFVATENSIVFTNRHGRLDARFVALQ